MKKLAKFRHPNLDKSFEETAQLGITKPDVANAMQTILMILCDLDARLARLENAQRKEDG